MNFKIFKEKNNQIIIFLALALIILNLVGANSPNVSIEPGSPYTTESLVCTHTFIGYDDYEINWYRNDVLEVSNSSNLSSSYTTKNELWTCEVRTYQSAILQDEGNRTVQIRNSAPVNLRIFFENGTELQEYQELYEDQIYNLGFNATDPDGDTLIYSITDTSGRDLCPNLNENTGQMTCTPTHHTLTGLEEPANENAINYTIRLRAEETTTEGFSVFRDFKFTIIPVNDQARFITEIPDMSLNALSDWEYLIEAYDEELDHPLNFSISTGEGFGLTLIEPNQTDPETTRILTFPQGRPTNDDVGNHTVTIFITDSFGFNESRPPTNHTFNLQINRTNEIPYIITNLSDIQGTQGEPFNLTIEARDPDENDTLSFIMYFYLNDSLDPNCTEENFVWDQNLTTITDLANDTRATINITNLTNNHVICRSAILEVRDQTGSSSQIQLFFNITNANDPPIIHETSDYEYNIGGQTNISELSISLFVSPALYKVNATDPDQLTYDVNNTGILTYTTNDTRFKIDPQTGILNMTFLGLNMIGNWDVLITVTDNEGLNDSRIMNIEILPNQPPTITIPEYSTFMQNDDLIISFNTTDNDGDSVYLVMSSNNPRFDQEIYAMSYEFNSSTIYESANITTWNLNLSNWIMNKTLSHEEINRPNKTLYANELVGLHNITITVYDQHHAHDENSSTNLIFTVLNENDRPFFDMNKNNVSDSQITFNNMALGRSRTEIIYATDFDLYLPNSTETLSYGVVNYSNITIISFNKHQGIQDTATLTFVPNQKGNQFVTIQVNDSAGASFNQTINFTVYEETEPPRFLDISPFFQDGETNLGFRTTTGLVQPLYVEWVENSTLTFDANIEIDEEIYINDPENGEANTLNTQLYVNNVLVGSKTNVNPMVNSYYDVYFDFFSAGTNNVTMVATDAVGTTSNWTWQVNVENVNRPPIYCPESLNDITFAGSITWLDYLGFFNNLQRFYDPDDDSANTGLAAIDPCQSNFDGVYELNSLTFDYITTRGNCDADFIFQGTTLIIKGYNEGMCYVIFTATDEHGESVESDEVIIEILEAITDGETTTEKTITVTETITIPVDHDVDVPKPISIIQSGEAIFYQNQTIEVPIMIKNDWTKELKGIRLYANSINTTSYQTDENLTISFSLSQINSLPIGQQQETTLILTDYRKPGPIIINVFAEVTDPKFTDSETIIIAGLEMTGDDPQSVRALVTYARDLLTSSPQCAELNDILDNANRVLEQGQTQEALRMIDAAINGCRYLMSQDETLRRERPGALKAGLSFTSENWSEIIIGSIVFIFVAIAVYIIGHVRLSLKDKQ